MLTRIDHIGIACRDLEATVEFYKATYGFTDTHFEVNEEQGVRECMLKINETGDGAASYLQLIEPIREDSAVAKWLEKNGEGVHHIAFGTDGTVAARPPHRGEGRPGAVRRAAERIHGILDQLFASQGLPRRPDGAGAEAPGRRMILPAGRRGRDRIVTCSISRSRGRGVDRRSVTVQTHLVYLHPRHLGTRSPATRPNKRTIHAARQDEPPTRQCPEYASFAGRGLGLCAVSCQAINRSPEPPVAPSHQD